MTAIRRLFSFSDTRAGRLLAMVAVLGLLLLVPAIRHGVLRAAGWMLVVQEPPVHAEAIVIALDADGAGVLEAADIFHSDLGQRGVTVAVLREAPDAVAHEFVRRGIVHEDAAKRSIRELKDLGVSPIEEIQEPASGTEDGGRVLPGWCELRHIHSILVVTSADHSRRLRRVMWRSMKSHGISVTVRASRYSTFDPDAWWVTRTGVRTEIVELEKLALDYVRHPFG